MKSTTSKNHIASSLNPLQDIVDLYKNWNTKLKNKKRYLDCDPNERNFKKPKNILYIYQNLYLPKTEDSLYSVKKQKLLKTHNPHNPYNPRNPHNPLNPYNPKKC